MYEYIYRPTCIGDNPKILLSKFMPSFCHMLHSLSIWFTTVLISHVISELICHHACLAVFTFLCQFMGKVKHFYM